MDESSGMPWVNTTRRMDIILSMMNCAVVMIISRSIQKCGGRCKYSGSSSSLKCAIAWLMMLCCFLLAFGLFITRGAMSVRCRRCLFRLL